MSELGEAARRAELAFANMGQAADGLADALAQALRAAQALQEERDRLLILLAMSGERPAKFERVSGARGIAEKRAQRSYLIPFQSWLRGACGMSRSTASTYRHRLCCAMRRLGVSISELASLDAYSTESDRAFRANVSTGSTAK